MEIIAEIGQNHNGDMVLAKELFLLPKKVVPMLPNFRFLTEETFGKVTHG